MRWRWPWWRRADDTADEARAELEKLEQRDVEVERLGAELREHQRHNHFSGMVWAAIHRGTQEGR